MSSKKKRFWEIDALRAIAIISMIIYHIFFDLYFFNIKVIDIQNSLIYYAPYFIGGTFLFLVGLSIYLSFSRDKNKLSLNQIRGKLILRGLGIFCLGLIITIVTYFLIGDGFIIFGVLHCIGLCIILSALFLKYSLFNLILGFFLLILGVYLNGIIVDFPYLLWLGLKPFSFYTVDYYPLLPWFGVVLIGFFIGSILYKDYERQFNLIDLPDNSFIEFMAFLGRHSLFIYFLHQIVIIGIISFFLFII